MTIAPGLYVIGTPIGNLGDITRRSVDVLRAAELLFAEDTRRARALLSHLGIAGKTLRRLDANAGDAELEDAVRRLQAGLIGALITDAGMPSVSDPGASLVRRCRAAEVSVSVVPGPSAVTAAVAGSGLVDGGFWFVGFLPRKGEKRAELLRQIAAFEDAVVLFEAPQRMQQTLDDLCVAMPGRTLCVGRELTKQFEEFESATLESFARAPRTWRGELTLVLAPGGGDHDAAVVDEADLDALITARLSRGESARTIADALSGLLRVSRRLVYQRVLQHTASP